MQHGVAHVDGGLAAKRPGPGQHFVKQHAGRKDVGALIDLVAPRLFRRGVGRRAVRHADFSQLGAINSGTVGFVLVEQLGKTEVENFTWPVSVTITLPDLMSRWMMPRACAAASASVTWIGDPQRAVQLERAAVDQLATLRPSTYCIAM